MADRRGGITLVTHGALPVGAPDDRLLAAALGEREVAVRFAVWDDPAVDWTVTPLAVIRSAWDYHHAPSRWAAWIDAVAAATVLVNPPEVLRWSSDKRYLLDLLRRGVPCIPTEVVAPSESTDRGPLRAIAARRNWDHIVVKPAVGASAFGVRRFEGESPGEEAEAHLRDLLRRGPALVQPYLDPGSSRAEHSLVYLAGEFAHAFSKPAFSVDATGTTVVAPYRPSLEERELATMALDAARDAVAVRHGRNLAVSFAYARVDLIESREGPLLMELELVEPDLALRLEARAKSRFADLLASLVD